MTPIKYINKHTTFNSKQLGKLCHHILECDRGNVCWNMVGCGK